MGLRENSGQDGGLKNPIRDPLYILPVQNYVSCPTRKHSS